MPVGLAPNYQPVFAPMDGGDDPSLHDGGMVNLLPIARPQTDYPTPETLGHRLEGNGPLKGWLEDGTQLVGAFDPGGMVWVPMQDIWGNAWIVALGLGSGSLYDTGAMAAPTARDRKHQVDALNKFDSACAANMAKQGFFIGEGGWKATGQNGKTAGAAMRVALDSALGSTGSVIAQDQDGNADPTIDLASRKTGPSVRDTNPYIDGVILKLPVADSDKGAFGGYVVCRVNRFLRMAVITDLYLDGWGDSAIAMAKRFDPDSLLVAIGKTIVGVVLVVVGVLCTVATIGGCAVAGVGLVVAGVTTIVDAWFDFEKQRAAQQAALDHTLNDPKGELRQKVADAKANANKAAASSSSGGIGGPFLTVVGGIALALVPKLF